MKLSTLQILYAVFATAIGADVAQTNNSNVVSLSESDFQEYVDSKPLVLAEFFAPWCGHCKNLAPEYEQVASDLQENENIGVAKMDCVDNREFCQGLDVQGFPTLYVFENGVRTGQYEGPRKADDIKNFLIKRSLPVVTNVKDAKGFDAWLSKNHEENPIVVLYTGPSEDIEDFTAVAKSKRDQLSFVSAPGATDIRKKFDNSDVVVLKNGEDAVKLPVGSKLDFETLEQFVHINEFPSFGELGPDTYSLYIKHNTPMLYAFVDDEPSRQLIKDSITPHLDILKGKANVVFLNASLYGRHTENVNLRAEQYPAIVVHDVQTNKKYVHDQDTEISKESVADFIKKYVSGKIEPVVKSEPIPESQDEPLFKLVGRQYDEIVLENDKDVLVEYYAPWCGHCKNLKPTYEELAELYEGNNKIVIAQLDHTVNEVPDEIQGYPTIKLYPAGKKDSPVTFNGARTLDGLTSFLQKEATNDASVPKKATKKAAKKASKAEDVKEEL